MDLITQVVVKPKKVQDVGSGRSNPELEAKHIGDGMW